MSIFPYVTVTTVLRGAGPEQIETDVTKKIEDAVNTIGGIDHIQSVSQEGLSIVIIQFKLEVDGKVAAQEVREKVAAARANLPTEIEDPVITRFDPASQPIFTLTVSGKPVRQGDHHVRKGCRSRNGSRTSGRGRWTSSAATSGKSRSRSMRPGCRRTTSPFRMSSRAWPRRTWKSRPET